MFQHSPRFEKAVGIDTRGRVVGAAFDQELQVSRRRIGAVLDPWIHSLWSSMALENHAKSQEYMEGFYPKVDPKVVPIKVCRPLLILLYLLDSFASSAW